MKIIATLLAIAIAGCGPVTTDEQDAAAACSRSRTYDLCVDRYIYGVQSSRNAQWSAIGAGLASRPVTTSCMNIGGIITCR